MDQHQREHHVIAGGHGVQEGESGDREARDDQDAAPAEAVSDGTGNRSRHGRRVDQESQKEAGLGGRAAERQNVKRRRGQQLKGRHEDGKAEAAHQEEARREEAFRRAPACAAGGRFGRVSPQLAGFSASRG